MKKYRKCPALASTANAQLWTNQHVDNFPDPSLITNPLILPPYQSRRRFLRPNTLFALLIELIMSVTETTFYNILRTDFRSRFLRRFKSGLTRSLLC